MKRIQMRTDEAFGIAMKVGEWVSSGWHLFTIYSTWERHESLVTWCSAAGDVILIDQAMDTYAEDGDWPEFCDRPCIVLILDKKRAAQFSLEFL